MLDTPIEYLKGVGPARGELLRSELNIRNFEDLLQHYPFRYIDRSEIHKISEINSEANLIQLKGRLSGIKEIKQKRGSRLEASLMENPVLLLGEMNI